MLRQVCHSARSPERHHRKANHRPDLRSACDLEPRCSGARMMNSAAMSEGPGWRELAPDEPAPNGPLPFIDGNTSKRYVFAPPSVLDRSIPITFFNNYAAAEKREEQSTMPSLAERIRTMTKSSKGALPWVKL